MSPVPIYAFVISFPEGGGGPRADVGEYGDFATNFSPCGGGNVGTSVELRGDWERVLFLFDRWQDGGGEGEGMF